MFSWLLWISTRAVAQEADVNCPCLSSDAVAAALRPFISDSGDCLVPVTSDGGDYCWPTAYGSIDSVLSPAGCSLHDKLLQPDCANANGPAPFYPQFCDDRWCYVDANECSERYVPERPLPSLSFPGSGLYYSYETCGSVQTFARFQQARDATAPELKIIIEDYAKDIRSSIEATFEMASSTESQSMDCAGITHGCSCPDCELNEAWTLAAGGQRQVLDFNQATLMSPLSVYSTTEMARDKCVSQPVAREIREVARLEYNDPNRIAYAYYGSQSTGSLVQWPGFQWCPTDYDARFRPWYATAASGPKDLVLVLDKSGSMSASNRWSKVQTGAKRALDTLGEEDFATVITFSSTASVFRDESNLHRMTQPISQDMKTFIDQTFPLGGTNFRSGLQLAANALQAGSASRDPVRTSGCSRTILFLTDGQDQNDFSARDIRTGELREALEGVKLFTYSFGTDIGDQQIMKKMACMTGGVWTAVPDGGNIENAMARYYQVYAAGVNARSARWVEYLDALTDTRLVSACYSVYDTASGVRELYGVVCVDLNMIISLRDFENKPGYSATWDEMRSEAEACSVISVTEDMLQNLRELDSSGGACRECDYDPEIDCPVEGASERDSRAASSLVPLGVVGLAPLLSLIFVLRGLA